LNTNLRGTLQLTENPGRPPEVRGVVTLEDGFVKAYEQNLELSRGALTFVGPIDDPLVDVVASKTIERQSGPVVVSVALTGSARNLETDIRSTPSYREGDALALLLTGRTLTEMSTGEQSNVYGTAIALGLGASEFTRSMLRNMNVEEIIVREEEGEWEVGAAVRLQRNLYLRYTYNVYSRLGGVLLRYALTDRISVRGRTGDAHSIELRYGID
jgi:translocation and assembly module TamB